jgi:uncharacterized protein involved in type VI secretion and phage assembly
MIQIDEITILAEQRRNRFFGKYRGEVKSNDDPAKVGRLQVQVRDVLEDELVWAMPCVPYAGDKVGFYCLPDNGAGVWVEFEGGNPRFPIWVGCYWKSGELPSEATGPSIRIWKTPKLTIKIDDDVGESLIQTGDDMKIAMTASDGIQTSFQTVKHTVASSGVTSDSGGVGKVEVTPASTSINGGALGVM